MSGPLICANCRHFDSFNERCHRPYEAGKIDLVTGKVSSGIADFDAYYERGNETHRMGEGVSRNLCGPSGRFFEAKP